MSMGWPEGWDPDTGEGWALDRGRWFTKEEVEGTGGGAAGGRGQTDVAVGA